MEARTHFTYEWKGDVSVASLGILLILQFYWFSLILKVLYGVITKGKAEDVRSDSEDDEDEDGGKKKA